MVAGASEDNGLTKEQERLAVPAEVADERDEMVIKSLQATFGSEAGVHRHHHSQQLGVESPVDNDKPLNLPTKCIAWIKIKRREGAVDLQRLTNLSCPLGPNVGVWKIKIRQHPVDRQRLSYRLPCPLPKRMDVFIYFMWLWVDRWSVRVVAGFDLSLTFLSARTRCGGAQVSLMLRCIYSSNSLVLRWM
jgi:hypothetical protein